MIGDLAAFLLVSAVVIVTPGQDTALTIRNSLLGGRAGGVFTAAGVSSGQAVWAVATSLGLAALLAASEPAFIALRLAGAAFLVSLGARALLDAVRRRTTAAHAPPARQLLASRAAYRQGLLSNLGNPKMAVFFTSLLPQFGSSFAVLLGLGLCFCALTFVWLSSYAFAVARAREVFARPRVRRAVDAITGAVLLALGLRLARES